MQNSTRRFNDGVRARQRTRQASTLVTTYGFSRDMVPDVTDTDTRYRKIAEVGHSNAQYYHFTMGLVKGEGNRGHKMWLLHHGLIETWDMVGHCGI